jgi:hypothetical protein
MKNYLSFVVVIAFNLLVIISYFYLYFIDDGITDHAPIIIIISFLTGAMILLLVASIIFLIIQGIRKQKILQHIVLCLSLFISSVILLLINV